MAPVSVKSMGKKRKPNMSWSDIGDDSEADASMLNSTGIERANNLALIEKYKDTTEISEVLRDLLIGTLQTQIRTSDTVTSLKHNIKGIKNLCLSNGEKIAEHDLEINQLRSTNHKLQSDVNILQQKEFETEVILSGFPDQPDEPAVLVALNSKFPQSANEISRSDSWATTINNKRTGFMTLSFINKNAQIKFMKAKIANGPVYLSELSREKNQENDKILIYFNNRLSPQNRVIQKGIRDLLKEQKIVKSRFRNCQYEVKLKADSEFIAVPSLEYLNSLI